MIRNDELTPYEKESPLEFAGRLADISASAKHAGIKQKFGQFFTPADTARFMTGFAFIRSGLTSVSILDPGTGTAVLSCALTERLIEHLPLKTIRLVCYEIDDEVLPFTKLSLGYLKAWLSEKNIELNYDLRERDFIMDNETVFNSGSENDRQANELFDYIISNPPFFKLSKEDKRTQIAGPVIFGQPNIYSVFIFISAHLLKEDGELLFLIPRSFCSGNYFRQFREKLLHHLKLKHIHLFGSERKIFEKSSVLSESVIVSGIRKHDDNETYELEVSSSAGNISYSFSFSSEENIIPLPSSNKDLRVLEIVSSWTGSLNKFGLKILAGRINRSLAADYICAPSEFTEDSVLFFDTSNTGQLFNDNLGLKNKLMRKSSCLSNLYYTGEEKHNFSEGSEGKIFHYNFSGISL
jgi:adenine-specific DNA-methyltransferase